MAVDDCSTATRAILAHLRTAPRLAYVKQFEGTVLDSYAVPVNSAGQVSPHIVVKFAGLVERLEGGMKSITSAADDSYGAAFTVASVAGNGDDAAELSQIVRNALVGFVPNAACGEITPAFFAGIGEISSLSSPTRFSADQAYDLIVNSTA